MYRIGYRTVKTAAGTAASIAIAQALLLPNAASAGIISILCIKPTQKKSLISAGQRFVACVLAIIFSALFFEAFGYEPLTVALLLLFFIPVTVMLKVEEGIITSSVIVLHFYLAEQFTWVFAFQEVLIIVIGIGMALVLNLYIPKNEASLSKLQSQLEEQYSQIFIELASFLREGRMDWNGQEITVAASCIEQGKELALRNAESYLLRNKNKYYHYFKMREKQFDIIERILSTVSRMPVTVKQGEMIADFLTELSLSIIHPENRAHVYADKLMHLKEEMRETDLPQTREEFEVRALLYYFITEMERYLDIKRHFYPV
ncbi:aromatic acid exporter family protein [Bacillaceae bacterium SIJ1]|uniref:aromatic acid exporter family protein n=1 Tax=Litoribacterium kuwaitense TaxID=1398745 RepID=UPI0013EA9145|nr:aromatic acid exporter family protein [Litoribacterium kuwaitense]NGP43627.1 aromatic acid exporter family protein [Litoribacterium kuwaitense]